MIKLLGFIMQRTKYPAQLRMRPPCDLPVARPFNQAIRSPQFFYGIIKVKRFLID